MNRILLATIALVFLPVSTRAQFVTWPIEHAVQRADLIVIGKRGAGKGGYHEVHVTQVLFGSAAKAEDTILVFNLDGYETDGHAQLWKDKPIDLQDRPILLCVSPDANEKAPANAFELQTTGYGTAIKVLDHHNVYGYYQRKPPEAYRLTLEKCGKEELLGRIRRAIKLTPKWAKIKSIADPEARQRAILDFLMDRTLPPPFCRQGCRESSSNLIAVIRDELSREKTGPRKAKLDHSAALRACLEDRFPDETGWTRLSLALERVKDDSKGLMPLLVKIKSHRPEHYESAVRCAARVCGPDAIAFLQEAMLDGDFLDSATDGLARIGTPQARAAIESALRARIEKHGAAPWGPIRSYAQTWPAAWKEFAAHLEKDLAAQPKVQASLDETWKALLRVEAIKAEHLPTRFTERYTHIIDRLADPKYAEREKATQSLRDLFRGADADAAPIRRGLLTKAAADATPPEIRRRAELILRDK